MLGKYKKAQKRIAEAGVEKFFYDRKVLMEDVGTIGQFVSSAKYSVTYIGCWLSSSLKQDLIGAIKDLVQKGIKFEFCLFSPDSELMGSYASFFNSDKKSIKTRIEDSILTLYQVVEQVPKEYRGNIKLFFHREIITTSFWQIDKDKPDSRIQLDFKLYNVPRHFSFGVEIVSNNNTNPFFKNVVESYMQLLNEKNRITYDYIEELSGERKQKRELQRQIIEAFPFDGKKPYLFISYSHKNYLQVYSDVLCLKQKKINCWIDFENLDGGRNANENDWQQKVKPVLESSRCKGVISYLSKDGMESKGFIKECDWIKINRPDFYVFLVGFDKSTNAEAMLSLIKETNSDDDTYKSKAVRDEAFIYLTQATSAGKESYYHYNENGTHLDTTDFEIWLNKVLKKETRQ
ncbi:MAG: toll/interleukin-1 receptor domain-containing protein [Clostridia bacterium]|nr:toll/interleukin-1 receptor domain-containing protein [Clostridia bacterium]